MSKGTAAPGLLGRGQEAGYGWSSGACGHQAALGPGLFRARVSKTTPTRVLATSWSSHLLPAMSPAHPQRWLASGRAI